MSKEKINAQLREKINDRERFYLIFSVLNDSHIDEDKFFDLLADDIISVLQQKTNPDKFILFENDNIAIDEENKMKASKPVTDKNMNKLKELYGMDFFYKTHPSADFVNTKCTTTSYVLSYLINHDEFDINQYYEAINSHIDYANGSDIILHYIEQEFHPALCFGLCQKLSELDDGFKKMKNDFEALYIDHLNVLYTNNAISISDVNSKLNAGDMSVIDILQAYMQKISTAYENIISALKKISSLFTTITKL